ncbi:5'-nucleotidase C-terminal domain-containing protein [Rossellomorea aquimaris]|uniref:5'-nucleotidase C-terminal domain-containing protein n=1 Tax=Rossellomorea TaxID=2837508 RepID=UPI0021CCA7FD|nr:5'-nucleotidase C-terminal domain-containing protein [Rossellomorea vietnamensis]
MNTSKKLVSLAVASALSAGAFAAPFSTNTVNAETENIKVQLLSLNDWHGQIDTTTSIDLDGDDKKETVVGGAQYLATHLKDYENKNENTLIVHSGDMIGGSPMIASTFQDEPVVEVMEAIGVDVGTVGNHEFDEGIAEFQRMVEGGEHPDGKGTEGYDGMNFPNIAANVYDKSTNELILPPYQVEEIGGTKIGFIGVATTATPGMVQAKGNENLLVTDELEAINKYAEELTEQGVESIVILAHNTAEEQDGEITGDVADWETGLHEEVDVIFAGHNHETVNSTIGDNVAVIQAWEYGYMFGAVNLEIDPATGDIVRENTEAELVHTTQDVQEDPAVKEIIDRYEEKIAPVKNEVVGNSQYEYVSQRYPFNERAYADHGMGNMIADSMKWAMSSDFALMNGGGIRAGLDAGPVTFGELYTIQPFQNMLQKFTTNGKGLRTILTDQISKYGLDYSISGFKYTYSFDHAEGTGEIIDIMLPDGTPIKDDENYTITTNDYSFANKGMHEVAIGETEIGPIDSDATADYVRQLDGDIQSQAEGRIMQVSETFKDVPLNHWANSYIFDLAHNEIVKGKTPEYFDPQGSLTRAQFASMLTRSLGLEMTTAAPFSDTVNLKEETQAEIAAAYEAGIIEGTTPDTFEPNQPITRAQMVTMLMRAYSYENGEVHVPVKGNSFSDISIYNYEMQTAINAAAELGYVIGYGDAFKPREGSTRGQAAKVLSLYFIK